MIHLVETKKASVGLKWWMETSGRSSAKDGSWPLQFSQPWPPCLSCCGVACQCSLYFLLWRAVVTKARKRKLALFLVAVRCLSVVCTDRCIWGLFLNVHIRLRGCLLNASDGSSGALFIQAAQARPAATMRVVCQGANRFSAQRKRARDERKLHSAVVHSE